MDIHSIPGPVLGSRHIATFKSPNLPLRGVASICGRICPFYLESLSTGYGAHMQLNSSFFFLYELSLD